ncbi:hypothetical protein [Neisseria sp. Ec49-e6-T10]|uniref:hypothetical protein n=1 Tax=Neisseria sp. Ec49-e6-T10 TaxID=3140744 RepID=UPI003EB874A3
MNNSLKLFAVSLISIGLLAACNDEAKSPAAGTNTTAPSANVVTSSDGAYSISLNGDFKDKIADKAQIAALRLPGTPVDKVTMLQLAGDEKTGDMVYGISFEFPAGAKMPPIDDLIKQMDVQTKSMPSVKNAQASKVEGTDNQMMYSMENSVGGITAYETCRMAVTDKLLTVCVASQNTGDKARLNTMIESFQVK